jgi:hypothetical protein
MKNFIRIGVALSFAMGAFFASANAQEVSSDPGVGLAQPDPNFQPKSDDFTTVPAEKVFPLLAKAVSTANGGAPVKITKVHLYENADGQSTITCGAALVGGRAARFVMSTASTATPHIDPTDAEWDTLGCNTPGGSEVVASHTGRVGPAKEPLWIPAEARAELRFEDADNLSQIFGAHVVIVSMRIYTEQDDTNTTCTTGVAGGKRFRLIDRTGDKPLMQPSAAIWVTKGCTRPHFLFVG